MIQTFSESDIYDSNLGSESISQYSSICNGCYKGCFENLYITISNHSDNYDVLVLLKLFVSYGSS